MSEPAPRPAVSLNTSLKLREGSNLLVIAATDADGTIRQEVRTIHYDKAAPLSIAIRYPAEGDAWKPDLSCYYFINDSVTPSFVIDVSDHYETKRRALACHASQFRPPGRDAVPTRLTSEGFPRLIESRDAQFGAQAGFAFAEGFVVRHPVVRSHLLPDEVRR